MRSVLPPWRDMGLPTDERTLPDVLADAGYESRACFGKWHLGHSDPKYHPLNRGFTRFHGLYNGAFDYFTHTRDGELDWHQNFNPSYEGGYATDLLSAHAVDFIQDNVDNEPFFLYLPYNAPHTPNQTPPEGLEQYVDSEMSGDRQIHAAMVSQVDNGVDRVLGTLDRTGLADDTVVFFLSDNGGSIHSGASNEPLRNGKQTTFEGGVRVPGAVRWPNGIEGGRTVSAPVSYTDVFTTILRMAGMIDYSPPGKKSLDGIDMLDVIRDEAEAPNRYIPFYWGNSDDGNERLAIVGNRWKLVYHDGPAVLDADLGDDELFLFDLVNDPEEQHDVIDEHHDVAAELLAQMTDFRCLQPDGAVPTRLVGQEGFVAPKEWDMEKWAHDSIPNREG